MSLLQHGSLAAAQAYVEYERKVFNSNEMTMYLLRCGVLDLVLNDPSGILRAFAIRVKASSNFDFRDNTEDGMSNLYTLDVIIGMGEYVAYSGAFSALQRLLLADANKALRPYENATQEEWDVEVALTSIVEQEVTYPSESYILTTSQQGIDVEITTDIDCTFTCYLAVCNDQANQNDSASYMRYNQAISIPVKSNNGKAIISLGNRKVRTFNHLYILPSAVCTFTAAAKSNRG